MAIHLNRYLKANKEYALTDSKLGSLDFRDGNWQGFWGTDLEILIDLEKQINIESISANFYQYNNSWIFFPEYFEAWKSDDNTNWTQIGKSLNGINPEKRGKLIQTLSINNINDKVRYIKVKAKNILLTPHLGFVTAENYSIYYTQMIESLESCVEGKPIRIIE